MEDRFVDLKYRFEKSAWKKPILILLAISCASGIGYEAFTTGYSVGRRDSTSEATKRVSECYDDYIISLQMIRLSNVRK